MILAFYFLLLIVQLHDDIQINDPWMRPNGKDMTTALYFTIRNSGELADTLYKVESDLAKKVEIHETYQKEDMMGMRPVDQIVVSPNSTFSLKPGSFHIMLIGLKQDIKKGDVGEITLFFKNAGEIKIKAVAKEMPSQKNEHHH